ncbi:hypothetical protein DXD09_01705 [Ligilactobacillus ruminis]|uniref:Uncharacterized protein n=1 Tax=Ligilactobacillus ruminis TaxID=1623 RepID=A0A8B2Z7B9_9LACO|nr:hypothetical protein DXD09_01705 [Ligilactobacillus ruminis]
MSVNPHYNGQKFTDKSLENVGLSVKCVLLTDKSSKIGSLSVNLSENLGLISCEKLFANRLHCSAFNLFQKKNGTFYRHHPGQKSYNDWFIFIISAPKMSSARKCSF